MKASTQNILQNESLGLTSSDAPLAERFLLEARHYTDPALLELEYQAIFRRTWIYLGNEAQLAQSGSVLVTKVADCSILLVHTPEGELKAFHNVCPHRAAPFLQTGSHQVKHLICPYHAWVYDLNGCLVGIPSQDRFASNFCPDDFPLYSVRVEVWEGFLFVCLDPLAPPLLEFLGSIPRIITGYRSEATQLLVCKHYPVQCNWKNYHDNTLCDYHVAIAHRETLNPVQGPIRFYEHSFDIYVNSLYTPTTKQWRAKHQVLEHLPERNRNGFFTFGIFPNLHLLILPDGIMAWIRIDPLSVNRSQVVLEIYGIPGISPSTATLVQEFENFMQEDIALTEGVQRGYASGTYRPGPVNNLEARIVHQQQLICQFLGI